MIIWIASYPKSGNTWVRALLSYYFFSKQDDFKFDILRHIPNFNIGDFVNENTKFSSNLEYADKALEIQKFICQKFKINTFFKTHCSLNKIRNNFFTNKSTSLGCVYIVRDPRNVITSYKNFEGWTYKQTLKFMTDETSFLYSNKITQKKLNIKGMEIINSWSQNYNSWVKNKMDIPICLVKYEDLLNNTLEEFIKIFNFIAEINKEGNIKIDLTRAKNTVKVTNFENLKNLELEKGFIENEEKSRKNNFFHKGKLNIWKEIVPKEIISSLENNFKKEMIELNYLK